MPSTVRSDDIVDALEMQGDDYLSFLDLDTGEVETVSRELLGQAEESDEDEEPDDEDPDWAIAKRIASSGRFVKLPTKFDVHEWEIMREFADSVGSTRIREDLLGAIHGAGAFRHFKDTVQRHRIEKAWFAFRTEALRQIARDWCQEHHIACK